MAISCALQCVCIEPLKFLPSRDYYKPYQDPEAYSDMHKWCVLKNNNSFPAMNYSFRCSFRWAFSSSAAVELVIVVPSGIEAALLRRYGRSNFFVEPTGVLSLTWVGCVYLRDKLRIALTYILQSKCPLPWDFRFRCGHQIQKAILGGHITCLIIELKHMGEKKKRKICGNKVSEFPIDFTKFPFEMVSITPFERKYVMWIVFNGLVDKILFVWLKWKIVWVKMFTSQKKRWKYKPSCGNQNQT